MATLYEESSWPSPIYLIERTDPLMGGEYGISNKQAQQLACRTRYLLDRILAEHDIEGSHLFTHEQVAAAANIAESKLALDVPTHELYENIIEAQELLASMLTALNSIQNLEESRFRAIYQALLLSWRFGYPRFLFEMFTANFSFRTNFVDVDIIETIAGDDSIDVTDSSGIVPGETYIIWDKEQNSHTSVKVKKILTNKRVILEHDESLTRSGTGVLTKMSWELQDGVAVGKPGSIYITRKLDLLKNFDHGNLVIAHYAPATFTVEYRREDSPWRPLAMVSSAYSNEIKLHRSVYETLGDEFYLRVTCQTDARIAHMAIMSDVISNMNSTVRTPEIVDNDFTIVRFGAIYGATHTGTYFEITPHADFTRNVTTLDFGTNTSILPIWDYKDKVLARYPMLAGEEVYWRVRYSASDGYFSRWSEAGHFVREV